MIACNDLIRCNGERCTNRSTCLRFIQRHIGFEVANTLIVNIDGKEYCAHYVGYRDLAKGGE